MSKFAETVKQDTPRLVVLFTNVSGRETYQWGVVGEIPILSLIGAIIRVQTEMFINVGEECPEPALVITHIDHTFDWYIHSSIPVESMVGMLETVKQAVLAAQIARQASQNQVILGPDGNPIPR